MTTSRTRLLHRIPLLLGLLALPAMLALRDAAAAATDRCTDAFSDTLSQRTIRALHTVMAVEPVWDDYRPAAHPVLLVAKYAGEGGAAAPVCAAIWRASSDLTHIELSAAPRMATPFYGMLDLTPVGESSRWPARPPTVNETDAARLREHGITRAVMLPLPLDFDSLGALGKSLRAAGADPVVIQAELAVHEGFHLHVQFPTWYDQPRQYAWPDWDRQPDRAAVRSRCYAGSPAVAAAFATEMDLLLAAFDALYEGPAPNAERARTLAREYVQARQARYRTHDSIRVTLEGEQVSCATAESLLEFEEGTAQWIGHATLHRAGLFALSARRRSYGATQPEQFYRSGPLQLWVLEGLLGAPALRALTTQMARAASLGESGVFEQLAATQSSEPRATTPRTRDSSSPPPQALGSGAGHAVDQTPRVP